MSDAIGHAIRRRQEAEERLLKRGWIRNDHDGSGLVGWTSPKGGPEMWLEDALDLEFKKP